MRVREELALLFSPRTGGDCVIVRFSLLRHVLRLVLVLIAIVRMQLALVGLSELTNENGT